MPRASREWTRETATEIPSANTRLYTPQRITHTQTSCHCMAQPKRLKQHYQNSNACVCVPRSQSELRRRTETYSRQYSTQRSPLTLLSSLLCSSFLSTCPPDPPMFSSVALNCLLYSFPLTPFLHFLFTSFPFLFFLCSL